MKREYFFSQYANVPICKIGIGYQDHQIELKQGYGEADPKKHADIISAYGGVEVTAEMKASRVSEKIKKLPKGESK